MSDVDWSEYAAELRRVESFSAFGSYTSRALKAAAALCELRATQTRGMLADDTPTPVTGTPRVCIESPLSGDVTTHVLYADACQFDSLLRDEAPFMGHLLYPRVLDDGDAYDRERGINAHLAWLRKADLVAFYIDFGVSRGMREALGLARELGLPIVERELGVDWRRAAGLWRRTRHFFLTADSSDGG